jgi:hypothetical protein
MPVGVPFNPKKEDVLDALKECKGVVTYAAKRLGVYRVTLQTYISKNDDLKDALHGFRFNFNEEQLDAAENVLYYALSLKNEDLPNALKAAISSSQQR